MNVVQISVVVHTVPVLIVQSLSIVIVAGWFSLVVLTGQVWLPRSTNSTGLVIDCSCDNILQVLVACILNCWIVLLIDCILEDNTLSLSVLYNKE